MVEFLKDTFPKFNVEKFVGHGGITGQQWKGEQDEIIRKFRGGEIRLLVSTSVLEEGIDVSECDLVIRFGGSVNLIQFIQSRGRARKPGSRYVLLLSDKEKQRIETIDMQEKVMSAILRNHEQNHDVFDNECREIYQMVKGKVQNRLCTQESESKKLQFLRVPVIELFICSANKEKVTCNEDDIRQSIED